MMANFAEVWHGPMVRGSQFDVGGY